jgi:HlyD family secretion protein
MLNKLKSRWVLVGVVGSVLLSAACVQLAPMARSRFVESSSPDDVQSFVLPPIAVTDASRASGSQAAGRGTALVRRGPISDVASLTGRIAGLEEIGIELPSGGRIQSVAVRAGQTVEQGQVLIEADSREIAKDLAAARSRIETGQLRVAQAQAQGQARRQEDGRRSALDSIRGQSEVAEADAALQRAQADLDRVKAGPSDSERAAAEVAYAQAAAAFERAQADLNRLLDGPNRSDLQSAEQEVANSHATLERAEADLARLKNGADPVDIRTAERDVITAESELARARAELNALSQPDSAAIRTAERDVDRAQGAIRDAQAMRVDGAVARAARDSAVRAAQVELQAAQDRLEALRQPPKATDLDLAKNKVQSAQLVVDNARDKLDKLRRPTAQSAIDAANAVVNRAQSVAQSADARLAEVRAGPTDIQLAPARAAVESARAALESARAKQADLNRGASPADVRDAEARVAAAQAAVARATAEGRATSGAADGEIFDVLLLQKGVDQDRAWVEALERDLAATHLVAPFSGVVTSVNVTAGDSIQPGRPVISIARPGERIVVVDLFDKPGRFAAGQDASVRSDGVEGAQLIGRVLQVTDNAAGTGKVAYVYVEWPDTPPAFGTQAQVNITVDQHLDALLVPEKAVRSNGARRYVEYMEGTSRRAADVQIGIVSGGITEILNGLREGQTVLVRP